MKNISIKDKEIIEKIVNKFINYLSIEKIYDYTSLIYENSNKEIKDNSLIIFDETITLSQSLIDNNTVIKLFDEEGFYLNYPESNLKISIHGKYFDYKKENIDNFKVLAIMHVYNEEDVIRQTILHLLNEGIDVYVLDNWSKDNTSVIINELVKQYPSRVFSEKYPLNKDNDCYDWYHQLEKTEQLSKSLDYDWFIHYDADEIRISPFTNATLKEMLYMADKLGFNLIENTVIDFKLTDRNQENIFMKDTYFAFGLKSGHFVQYKTWKKCLNIDLKKSGGHEAIIDNPKVFPLKVLNKHYPFRSIKQATKKVFIDRNTRYRQEERDIGWHSQYDVYKSEDDFIVSSKDLILYDKDTIKKYYPRLFIDARL